MIKLLMLRKAAAYQIINDARLAYKHMLHSLE